MPVGDPDTPSGDGELVAFNPVHCPAITLAVHQSVRLRMPAPRNSLRRTPAMMKLIYRQYLETRICGSLRISV